MKKLIMIFLIVGCAEVSTSNTTISQNISQNFKFIERSHHDSWSWTILEYKGNEFIVILDSSTTAIAPIASNGISKPVTGRRLKVIDSIYAEAWNWTVLLDAKTDQKFLVIHDNSTVNIAPFDINFERINE